MRGLLQVNPQRLLENAAMLPLPEVRDVVGGDPLHMQEVRLYVRSLRGPAGSGKPALSVCREGCSGGAEMGSLGQRPRRAEALTAAPAPGPVWPGSGPKRKTFHSLPWRPPPLWEAGCYLKFCKPPTCFSSWSSSFRTISSQFQSWNGPYGKGSPGASQGQPKKEGSSLGGMGDGAGKGRAPSLLAGLGAPAPVLEETEVRARANSFCSSGHEYIQCPLSWHFMSGDLESP